jgi:phenylpyruvate tautomerase PptA (4-oxalocrotonate tautomerase family)
MPTILVKVPKGAYPVDARKKLVDNIIEAAKQAEQIPSDPKKLFVSWVVIEETEAGMWTCGGVDMSEQILTCFAMVNVPSGVLDAASRALYVKLIQEAFKTAQPTSDKRPVFSSVILSDVVEGTWGGTGTIWTLAALAKAAGFAHLQHLVEKD